MQTCPRAGQSFHSTPPALTFVFVLITFSLPRSRWRKRATAGSSDPSASRPDQTFQMWPPALTLVLVVIVYLPWLSCVVGANELRTLECARKPLGSGVPEVAACADLGLRCHLDLLVSRS